MVAKIQKFFVNQSGGRIVDFNDNKILFSTGAMRAYYKDESKKIIHEQDVNSKFGKVISINLETLEDKIFTLGHRNPQGLLYDKENNIVLETEHGPQGGDEINLIKLNHISASPDSKEPFLQKKLSSSILLIGNFSSS